MLKFILAIFSIAVGLIASLFMEVMLMAGGANAKPRQIRELKLMMLGIALGALISALSAIWAMARDRLDLAIWLGLLPLIVSVALFAYLWVIEY